MHSEQFSRDPVLDLCFPDIPVIKILRAHHNLSTYITYVSHNIRKLIALNGSKHNFGDKLNTPIFLDQSW